MKKIQSHPLYEQQSGHWKKLIDTYEGTGGFRDGSYLYRHDRESDSKFINRCWMAKYFNFAEIIVDTFRDSCLRERPIRAVEDKNLQNIMMDVDFQARDWDSFIRDQLTLSLVYGFSDALVEMPSFDPDAIRNRADAENLNIRPYLISLHPLDIINWDYDRYGLNSVMIRETARREIQPGDDDNAEGKILTHYRRYDRERWTLFDADGSEIASGEHSLGVIPIVRLFYRKSLTNSILGRSILPDPAVFIDYYNLDSEKREIFRQQTFSLLLISLGENSSRDDIQNLVLTGTNNALALPYGAKAEFISPDPEQARLIIEEQKQIIRTIFRLKHLKYDTDSGTEKSGEAYKWDYKDMHEILAGIAKNLETFEYQIVRLISLWTRNNEIASRFSVSYPREFNVHSLSETLETAAKLFELNLGTELRNTFSKRVLIPKLLSLTTEEKEKIFKNIEETA
jgi:hypothetical protein